MPRLTRFIPQSPTLKQKAFLLLDSREALFGGSVGGGKSSALLMAGLQYADIPGYAALILRATFTDLSLPGALMDRAASWLTGTGAKWNGNEHSWTFPTNGAPAMLQFGYLDTPDAHLRYQSAEFQAILIDELSQHREYQYRWLFSRLRRLEGMDVPIRMRGATNPGGPGEEWVRTRFGLDPQRPDLRQAAIAAGRLFVPSQLEDNPYLDTAEYEQSLAELPEDDFQRLRYGDWSVKPKGSKFRREWFRVRHDAPDGYRWLRYWDLASTDEAIARSKRRDPDYTAGVLLGEKDGRYVIGHAVKFRRGPAETQDLIRETAGEDGIEVPIVIEQESGASGVIALDHFFRNVLRGFDFRADHKTVSKEIRANPVAAAASRGYMEILADEWNTELLDELEAFPSPTVHDDYVDALSGAFAALSQTDAPGTPATRAAQRMVPLG